MTFARAQVAAALEALGLDPTYTSSVVIGPSSVYVEVVTLADGYPVVEYGALKVESSSTPITEEAPE